MELVLDCQIKDIITFYRENAAIIGAIVASKATDAATARKVEVAAVIVLAGFHHCKELSSVIEAALDADDHALADNDPFWALSIVDAMLAIARN